MHFSSVIHILGYLQIFLGAAMVLPVPFSLYYGDSDWIPLLISAGVTSASGLIAFSLTRSERKLRPKEGFVIVTFGLFFFSVFGSLPFLISGSIPSVTDAFFETMSGFTTTGASILTNIESLPHGILFWRSLTHWIGGMGIIVLSLAILPLLGVGGMQLLRAELPGPTSDKLAPRVTETAKILWGVYVLLSAIETVLLMLGGMSLFEALCNTFGTVATGGFSPRNGSIGAYHSAYIDYVVITFMILAGTNFSLHYRFSKGNWKVYFRNQEFLFFLSIIGITTLFIGMDTFINHYDTLATTLQKTTFQVVSIVTCTGFVTANYEHWAVSSQLFLFLLMFIGGCAGSTSGGLKVVRVFVLLKFIYSEIIRLIHPHAVVSVRFGSRVIPREVLGNVLGFFILYIFLFVFGVSIMALLGMDIETSFSAVATTMGNIGPGLGQVGPTDNYVHIPVIGKWLLSFLMLAGRLEIFTVIILFSPSFWSK